MTIYLFINLISNPKINVESQSKNKIVVFIFIYLFKVNF